MAEHAVMGRPVTVDVALILDAVAELVEADGIRAVTLAEVAHHAGVSRRTLYRYFASRDGLIDALISRERDRFVAAALDAPGQDDDLRAAATASIRAVLTLAETSRLLATLRATEPELLYPRLGSPAGIVIDVVAPATDAFLAHHLPDADPSLRALSADLISRLLVSYVADPPRGPIYATADAIARLLVSMLETTRTQGASRS